ncbi:hypothetical protein dsx2_1849 [Desulfovibrio sp. X2]|uniref:hypothetical protein n=1 Tax=Desulfovibrio sp. X2 TaxID=941449 RepID=UPI000358996A|nr:hypothetical protein [Desulfovibrio sp. X2]EPR44105.1 hypothetical protein dsx2_1849 [Desulfovibrio sp. X2]
MRDCLRIFLLVLILTAAATHAVAADAPDAASDAPDTGDGAAVQSQSSGGSVLSSLLAAKLYAQAALDVQNLSQQYEGELDKAGFYKLLNPQRLSSDPDLSKGKAIVARSRSLARTYRGKSYDLLAQGQSQITALDTDEETRARLSAAWERRRPEAKAQVAEAWKLEDAVIDRMADLVDFLADRKGAWHVRGQTLSFDRSADVDTYRRLCDASNKAMQAEDDFQAEARSKAFKQLLELAR